MELCGVSLYGGWRKLSHRRGEFRAQKSHQISVPVAIFSAAFIFVFLGAQAQALPGPTGPLPGSKPQFTVCLDMAPDVDANFYSATVVAGVLAAARH
eukprot:scaffold515101_cov41-Prasinocladus_malaysianus.AAC.1